MLDKDKASLRTQPTLPLMELSQSNGLDKTCTKCRALHAG